MKQIKSFSVTHLLVGQHYEFHLSTATLITEAGAAVLHVNELFPQYLSAIQTQLAIINRNQHMINTELLETIDAKRDALLSVLFGQVRVALFSPIAADAAAGHALRILLSPYRGIGKNEYTKETAQIRGLLRDLGTDEAAAQINALKLGPIVTALRQTNNEFADAMEERVKTQAAHHVSVPTDIDTRQQQRVINDIYNRIVQQVNAYAITSTTPAIDTYIEEQNALIEQYKHVISSQRPGGSGNESISPKEEDEWPEEEI